MSPASKASPDATLLIETADDKLEPRSIGHDVTIGRDRRNGVMIDHPTVSRSHARIYRDQVGWHFVDLGSQNGSKLGETRARAESSLRDGAELRIGRVRAWFFAGAVPPGWSPPNAPRLAGKLIRCTCGHIGWAPITAGNGQLRCTTCGREIARRDPTTAQSAAGVSAIAANCAACHTTIDVGEQMHSCSACAATMHAECWRENLGCATYGCTQVGALEGNCASDVKPANIEGAPTRRGSGGPRSEAFRQSVLAVAVFAIVGIVTFGVPPIGYGAWRLVTDDHHHEGRRRYAWAIISFAAGIVGFACSARWLAGMHL